MVCLMKSNIAAPSHPHEYYVCQIDGRVKSQHRRFVDALRAALQLRDSYPHHDVKVRSAQSSAHESAIYVGAAEAPTI
jgi:GrpB-like predicted nucleotidyltransferase (UPF0157 family)